MTGNRRGGVIALAISAGTDSDWLRKASEHPQPTAEDIAKALMEEMQASAEEQGMGWKSVDSIEALLRAIKAALFLTSDTRFRFTVCSLTIRAVCISRMC